MDARTTGRNWIEDVVRNESIESLPTTWDDFTRMAANANCPPFPCFDTDAETDDAFDGAWEWIEDHLPR